MTDEELKAFNPDFDRILKIFRENFYFTEEDIKQTVKQIYASQDHEFITNLSKLFYAFVNTHEENVDTASRRRLARKIVSSAIELYVETNKINYTDFIEVIDSAKGKGVDPYRLAIKSNMATGDVEAFESTIDALTGMYVDKNTGKLQQLFTQQETRALINKCASVAYKATKQKVKAVLEILSDLLYDKESGHYIVEPKTLIRQVPSLLARAPKDIADTIDLLLNAKDYFPQDRATIVNKIISAPSILLINNDNLIVTHDQIKKAFESVVDAKGVLAGIKAENLTKEIFGNLNNLTQLDKVDSGNIATIAKHLKKYLGQKNAITCLGNLSVLTAQPETLEYVLATLVRQEKMSGQGGLREDFVASPYSFLHIDLEEQERLATGKREHSYERTIKENLVIAQMPELSIDEDSYRQMSLKVKKSFVTAFTDKNITKLSSRLRKEQKKQAQELAKQKKADDEARLQEWIERQARERAAQLEQKKKNKSSRRNEHRRNAYNIASNSTSVSQELKPATVVKETKTPAQLQAERRAAVNINIGNEIEMDLNFDKLFWPIVSELPKENRSLYNKIKKIVAIMSFYAAESIEISSKIQNSAENWKNFIYDEETQNVRSDLMSALAQKDEITGKINLQQITDVLKSIQNDLAQSESQLKDAQNLLAQCCKNTSVNWPISIKFAKDARNKNQSPTDYEQINPIELNRRVGLDVTAYIDSLDDKCIETYGCKLTELLPDESAKKTYEKIRHFLSMPLSPDTCARLDELLCHWFYCEEILNFFVDKDYMYVISPNSRSKFKNDESRINLNPPNPLDKLENILAEKNVASDAKVLLIDDEKLEEIGISKGIANDFASTYKSVYEDLKRVLTGVMHKTSTDGDLRIKFYEDDQHEYLIEYKKGSHRILELMPAMLFKHLRSKEKFQATNNKSEV